MPKTSKQLDGQAAEDAALALLLKAGLRLLMRNYSCRWGEVDLVMKDKNCIVFVEVRYRRSSSHGGAAASVDNRKQAKLQKTAQHYLQRHAPSTRQAARIDVIAVHPQADSLHCEWIPNAVQ